MSIVNLILPLGIVEVWNDNGWNTFSGDFNLGYNFFLQHKINFYVELLSQILKTMIKYIDGCSSVDHINCSLVTPVSGKTQSDGY